MHNTQTKKHVRKDLKSFKKKFAADPTIFVESASVLPPMNNVPATVPERAPLPPLPPPAIGDPQQVPVLTQEEIDKALSQRAQGHVENLVATELKVNPGPYKVRHLPSSSEC